MILQVAGWLNPQNPIHGNFFNPQTPDQADTISFQDIFRAMERLKEVCKNRDAQKGKHNRQQQQDKRRSQYRLRYSPKTPQPAGSQ
jgi:hypothetical protein